MFSDEKHKNFRNGYYYIHKEKKYDFLFTLNTITVTDINITNNNRLRTKTCEFQVKIINISRAIEIINGYNAQSAHEKFILFNLRYSNKNLFRQTILNNNKYRADHKVISLYGIKITSILDPNSRYKNIYQYLKHTQAHDKTELIAHIFHTLQTESDRR